MADDHFTVDGTLIQAWASQKSFRPKDGSDDGDGTNFHGQKRSNETHESTTDPDARLYKKSYGKESHMGYLGHALVENGNGLIAAAMATTADGFAEREAALRMLEDQRKGLGRITVGADKAYDSKDFVEAARKLTSPCMPRRTTRSAAQTLTAEPPVMGGYATSLSRRWLVEKGLRLAQADRADAAGEAPRTTQGGLAVRLQLRRPQLMQTPQADGPECGVRPPKRAVPPRSPEPPRRLKVPCIQAKTLLQTESTRTHRQNDSNDASVRVISTSS